MAASNKTQNGKILWNKKVKFIISDVDETVADLYKKAEPGMIQQLVLLLRERKVLFFVTGQSLKSLQWRIVDFIPNHLRRLIIVAHCSGAEVWGYDKNGKLNPDPFYSLYESELTDQEKKRWRQMIQKLVNEFKLKIYSTMPIEEFNRKTKGDPLSIMLEDRGPQITFEVVNGYDLSFQQTISLKMKIPKAHGRYDLRLPIIKRAQQLIQKEKLPISPRLAGVFAVDFAIKGVSKTTVVKTILKNNKISKLLRLTRKGLNNSNSLEIWGDKFSKVNGGTDRHMSEACSKNVRSIDFREENPNEFLKGYNIVVWDGKAHLHHGLLEYLKSRKL